MAFFCIIKYRNGEEKHHYQYNVCCQADPEVDDAADVQGERTRPHKRQDSHNEHSAGWVWNVSQWVFAGVKDVLITVINPKSEIFHYKFSS
jgi:hypothetical protein